MLEPEYYTRCPGIQYDTRDIYLDGMDLRALIAAGATIGWERLKISTARPWTPQGG